MRLQSWRRTENLLTVELMLLVFTPAEWQVIERQLNRFYNFLWDGCVFEEGHMLSAEQMRMY